MSAGYSGTPLVKKLGIKPGSHVLLVGAPGGFEDTLEGLPDDARVSSGLRGKGPFDIIVFFTKSARELGERLPRLRERMTPACGLWVAWPKKASGVAADITENVVRDLSLLNRLVDNKVCAIDPVWSGLRVVIRLKDR